MFHCVIYLYTNIIFTTNIIETIWCIKWFLLNTVEFHYLDHWNLEYHWYLKVIQKSQELTPFKSIQSLMSQILGYIDIFTWYHWVWDNNVWLYMTFNKSIHCDNVYQSEAKLFTTAYTLKNFQNWILSKIVCCSTIKNCNN
jgi:hypothetical protein